MTGPRTCLPRWCALGNDLNPGQPRPNVDLRRHPLKAITRRRCFIAFVAFFADCSVFHSVLRLAQHRPCPIARHRGKHRLHFDPGHIYSTLWRDMIPGHRLTSAAKITDRNLLTLRFDVVHFVIPLRRHVSRHRGVIADLRARSQSAYTLANWAPSSAGYTTLASSSAGNPTSTGGCLRALVRHSPT